MLRMKHTAQALHNTIIRNTTSFVNDSLKSSFSPPLSRTFSQNHQIDSLLQGIPRTQMKDLVCLEGWTPEAVTKSGFC